MVTKNLVRKETGAGGISAALAVVAKENHVNEQLPKGVDAGDERCAPRKETSENVQPGSFGSSEEICQGHSKHDVSALSKPTDDAIDEGKLAASASAMPPPNNNAKKKRSLVADNEDDNGKKKSREMCIDLSDVPAKPLILKGSGKSGTSKYQGVCFLKARNKWKATLTIDGKQRTIGCYNTEDEAAADYARAVFKFKYAPKKPKQMRIDLTDVPAKPPILKGSSKSGSSKYRGVHIDKVSNKWKTDISIGGKSRHIGYYNTEEEAAADYARAVFKYAPKKLKQMRIDLTDVPAKPLILKVGGKSGSSKYQGVYLDKARNKWQAHIRTDGKKHYIGLYDNEEDAAADYARAVFKYKERKTEVVHQRKQSTDVSEKFSVPKGSVLT